MVWLLSLAEVLKYACEACEQGGNLEKTIGNFVVALRRADVAVSPAETLDAMAAIEIVGVDDKKLFQNTLSIILAKTPGLATVLTAADTIGNSGGDALGVQ